MKHTRRESLQLIGSACLLPVLPQMVSAGKKQPSGESGLAIATNTYPWMTFARREQQTFQAHAKELLANIASTGITGYEPIINSANEFNGLQENLEEQSLSMRSIYVNSTLHDEAVAEESVQNVLEIAQAAKKLGTTIIVTNPAPIRWGGDEDKSDKQLRFQAKTLNELGERLRSIGITLAYHNHDAELRQGGREFHHMLTATKAENVKLCLDAHWIFRGCGNSEVAVFDAVSHYMSRVVELHLRQSLNGIWTEAFQATGDIDYPRLIAILKQAGIEPHLVLEQAIEAATPQTIDVVEAHRLGRKNLHSIVR